jgi:hypothetical protein
MLGESGLIVVDRAAMVLRTESLQLPSHEHRQLRNTSTPAPFSTNSANATDKVGAVLVPTKLLNLTKPPRGDSCNGGISYANEA